MFRSRIVGPLLFVAFAILVLRPPAAPASATLIPIPIINGRPTALGVYQAANKLIVANSQDASLMIYDGATRGLLATLPAGRNVYDGALVVDETYGRAYAASRDGDQGSGAGTGAIYVVNMATNALLTTIPKRVTSGNSLALAHDPVRHRVYVADAGRLSWVNVATNTVTAVDPPAETGELFFRPSEMVVNAATNDVFLAQDTYG